MLVLIQASFTGPSIIGLVHFAKVIEKSGLLFPRHRVVAMQHSNCSGGLVVVCSSSSNSI